MQPDIYLGDEIQLNFVVLGADDCEFDYDKMCHWKNDPTNSEGFDWIRHTGNTPSGSTGPSADHTSGSGIKRQQSIL